MGPGPRRKLVAESAWARSEFFLQIDLFRVVHGFGRGVLGDAARVSGQGAPAPSLPLLLLWRTLSTTTLPPLAT
jgi:hypothetical protein